MGDSFKDALNGIYNKVVEKYVSLPIFFIICLFGAISFISDDWTKLTTKDYIIIGSIGIFYIGYAIYVWRTNRLPKAKTINRAILFVIFAETTEMYDDIKNKLIAEFSAVINCGGIGFFDTKYINADQIKKYNLDKKEDALTLLQKTNCAFMVRVRYIVDSVTNAENYAMHINCSIVHPTLTEKAQSILQHDLNALANPISRRKFKSSQKIDELEFTAQQLSIMCVYVIGLVEVFSGKCEDAYVLFKKLSSHKGVENTDSLKEAVKYWLFICCIENNQYLMATFQNRKTLSDLESADNFLEEANALFPSTYGYYLNKAYYYIASQRDATSATKCIAECRRINSQQSWKYSDAFLAAYKGNAASTIISKYTQAFKTNMPPQQLTRIIDFVEYIISTDSDHTGLYLAAALLYTQFDDSKLQKENLDLYFANELNIKNKETAKRYFSKPH